MAESGLAQKIRMKSGQRVAVVNAPAGYLEKLEPLPEGVKLSTSLEGTFDFILLFVNSAEELEGFAAATAAGIVRDGVLWIAYPKGSGKVKPNINRDAGWGPILSAGLEAVSLVAIDDRWAALRFRPGDLVKRKGRE